MECPNCLKYTPPASARCWSCGATIPPGQSLLEEAGVTGTKPEVEPAIKPVSPRPLVDACPIATLGDRCIATVLDGIVLLAVSAVIGTWGVLRWSSPGRGEWGITSGTLLVALTLDVLIFFVYLWLLEAGFGATIGKAIVGIRIIGNSDRGALSASAIRNLLRIVDGFAFYLLGLMVASCSRQRQRVGDLCAGTLVVAPRLDLWPKALGIVLWLATLAGAGWTVSYICDKDYGVHRIPHLDQVVARLGRTDNSFYVRVAGAKVELVRNDNHWTPQNPTQATKDASPPPVPSVGD